MDIQNEINRQLLGDLKALTATATATQLLKDSGLSTKNFNAKCLEHGYLERGERPSKSKPGEVKTFWKLTPKGLEYGVNVKDQREPLESSPRWFAKEFPALIALVGLARPA